MQRFWSVISTTFLIEYHWFLLYWIEYLLQVIWHQVHIDWIRRFDSRAIILWQCHFQNVPLFPRKQAWSSWNLFQNQCWQKHNCPHFEKEDSMNDSEAFITQLCGTKFQLLQACLRGESITFWKWHCLRKIALESKCPIHTWWTWCQITWKRIFYPIQ